MAKKENCSTCHDRGFIEYEHGLICEHCPEQCPASIALKKRMFPDTNYQDGNEVFKQIDAGAITGGDKGTAGSDTGEAAGDRQPEGKEAKKKVRKGTKSVLSSTRKKSTVSRPPRVP